MNDLPVAGQSRRTDRSIFSAEKMQEREVQILLACGLGHRTALKCQRALYSPPYGRSALLHYLRNQTKQKQPIGRFFVLVAEGGFEPHDLRVMSPTSYRTALLRDIIGAGSRGRTGTRGEPHGILSPGRLPIPPFRHVFRYLPKYDITKQSVCQ